MTARAMRGRQMSRTQPFVLSHEDPSVDASMRNSCAQHARAHLTLFSRIANAAAAEACRLLSPCLTPEGRGDEVDGRGRGRDAENDR